MVRLEQFIGDYSIPVDGINNIPLNKVAYDIENPAVRKTDFSKSIRIPESKEVNKVFEHIFEYNSDLQTFNPNKKEKYLLIGNGIPLMNGFCQLVSVADIDGKRHYIITAKGAIGDLYSAIGESKLTDLDFSDMNHVWNKVNIEASWTPTIGTDYVYPMIHYGDKVDQNTWYVQDFKPAIFLKEYIDRMFESAGFTYSSAFFDSTRFKSLVIPQSSDVVSLSDSSIRDRQYLVERSTDQTAIPVGLTSDIPSMGTFIFDDDLTPLYNTTGNDYNTANGQWIVGAGSAGTFAIKGYFIFNCVASGMPSNYVSLYQDIVDNLIEAYQEIAIVRIRGGVEEVVDVQSIDVFSTLTGATISTNWNSPQFVGAFTSADLDFEAGDIITIRAAGFWVYGGSGTSVRFAIYDNSDFGFDIVLEDGSQSGAVYRESTLNVGDTLNMNDTIQEKITQKELFNAIVKRFNLYMEYDTNDDKNIIIEPLKDYMTEETEDISAWIDVSKERVIKPMGALKNGQFLFQDKEDEDVMNQTYQLRKADTYGAKVYDVDSDFLTAEKKIETIFSPCPLWSAVRDNDRIISSIAFPRDVGGYASETANLKLLYWGGLLPTNYDWVLAEETIAHLITGSYPYAGHLNNPFNPQFDVCWSVPKLLFYDFSAGGRGDLVYTDSNCFNLYWKKHIEEITDKNSKVLENYVVLDAHRYNQLSFRKKYFIDGAYWRLLEVTDFDARNPKTTKCTWIKLKRHAEFVGTQQVTYGGVGDAFPGGDDLPQNGMMSVGGGGSGYQKANLVFGEGNQYGMQSILNSNKVFASSGSRQTFATGSDGAKLFGNNTSAINSPGVELYRPDETAVNGVIMEKQIERILTDDEMINLNTSPLLFLPNVESDEFIRITRAYAKLNSSMIPVLMSSELFIRTTGTNSNLAETDAAFFSTADNKAKLTLNAESLDFGEGLEIYQATDMEGGTGATLKLVVVYQVIKL